MNAKKTAIKMIERVTAAITGNESYSHDSGYNIKKKQLLTLYESKGTYIGKANECSKSKAK